MKYSSLLLIATAAWFAQACSSSNGSNETLNVSTDVIPVKVIALNKQDVSPLIQTSGLFTTDDETMLAFKTGGVIDKIYVKEGDKITKGQLLATLNLTEIEAQVGQAKLAFEKAKRDFSRVENLYKDSVATLEQFQNARTGMDVAKQQLEAANFNRSYSEIRAHASGFVLRKLANEGQVIAPGVSVLQTNGASQNNWKVRVGVSDREWAAVVVGDKATVTTDALPGQSFEAVVSRKSEGAEGAGGTFTIELSLKKVSNAFASGLFAKASIETKQKQSVWPIPYAALLDGDAQTGYVFTTNDSKTAQKTPVTIRSVDRDHVIISSGLENASYIIVSGSAYLRDKSPIQVIQ